MNKSAIENNTTMKADKKKEVLKKQEKIRKKFVILSEKLRISDVKAEDTARKKLDNDNLFMDNMSSPFNEIELFGDKVSDAMMVEQGNSDTLTNETIKELKDKRDVINELRFDKELSLDKDKEINEIVDSGRDSEFNLPEAFWEVKDNNQEKDVESIDEQVKKLKLVV